MLGAIDNVPENIVKPRVMRMAFEQLILLVEDGWSTPIHYVPVKGKVHSNL
jgi:hypothetical protein